jgi:hypothetical protein
VTATETTATNTARDKRDRKKAEEQRKEDFDVAIRAAGFSGAVLKAFPELGRMFKTAIENKWSADKFKVEVQKTGWYMSRTDAQRSWDLLEKNDPKTFTSDLDSKAAQITARAAEIGVPISAARALTLARMSGRNGFEPEQDASLLGAEFHYDPTQAYGGLIGDHLQALDRSASDYMVDVTADGRKKWAEQFAKNQSDPVKFEEWAKRQAKAKYAHLSDQLDTGMTMRQIADPIKAAMANVLEVDPSAISDNDNFVQSALSYRGSEGNGALGLMPASEQLKSLKRDPRWLKTNNAKISMMSAARTLTDMFGVSRG